jgi:uncharacterized repeat protein (TIGR01451 family)
MKKYLLSLFATAIFYSLSLGSVSAATTNCKPIYGGGESCAPTANISIDKKIIHPVSGQAVDNLTVNNVRFKPGQDIRFAITVTNTGATILTKIELTDELPSYISYTGGSANFKQEKQVIRFTIDKLNPNQSKTYEVRAKIVEANALPANEGTFCSTKYAGALNKAHVVIADKRSDDSAGFCIQKDVTVVEPTVIPTKTPVRVIPAKSIPATTKGGQPVYQPPRTETTPETGPELLALLGFIPTAIGGHILRKKSK